MVSKLAFDIPLEIGKLVAGYVYRTNSPIGLPPGTGELSILTLREQLDDAWGKFEQPSDLIIYLQNNLDRRHGDLRKAATQKRTMPHASAATEAFKLSALEGTIDLLKYHFYDF